MGIGHIRAMVEWHPLWRKKPLTYCPEMVDHYSVSGLQRRVSDFLLTFTSLEKVRRLAGRYPPVLTLYAGFSGSAVGCGEHSEPHRNHR